MGFEFTGQVLRAPRQAPGNAVTTSDPSNGVIRAVQPPPATRVAETPDVIGLPGTKAAVDLYGDQYRVSVLDAAGSTPQEYLVWAANSSQLALVDDPSWWTSLGSGRIPVGTLPIYNLQNLSDPYQDGADRVVVTDNGGREIGAITHLVIARGDKTYDDHGWSNPEQPSSGRQGTQPYEVVVPSSTDQNSASGVVNLTDANVFRAASAALVPGTLVTILGGGVSLQRGDVIVEVRYTVAPMKFWWTRNDRYETRFGWDGTLQRWTPYKGSAPVDLGPLLFDTTYTLSPKMRTLPLGTILTGDAQVQDGYAMVRLGPSPGALSLPVGSNDSLGYSGIRVVADTKVEGFDFSGTTLAGVVGQNTGTLVFNPLFVQEYAGRTVWYAYGGFSASADGILGEVKGSDKTPLYLAPVPGPTDHPILRIANRSPLSVTLVDTEALLEAAREPLSGFCIVAQSTGRLRLSQADIRKADPDYLQEFDKQYLGAQVIYGGVALNSNPQPTKAPVPLVQDDGVTTALATVGPMYLPTAQMWPEDVEGTSLESYMGLGVSGVLYLPDGTGAVPTPENVDPSAVAVPVRPGGDSIPSTQSLGLVREIRDGVGDTILFSRGGAITDLVVVDKASDLPQHAFKMPGGVAYISKEALTLPTGDPASIVQIGSAERKTFAGQDVYFLQASLTPATYTETARIYSKGRLIFRFDGSEVFYFSIGGFAHSWFASSLPVQEFYLPSEVAASIQARIIAQGGTGLARAVGDRILLEAFDPDTETVEIGWGLVKDLSGCTALGFLPGWRAVGGSPNWLPDSGISVGLARSLLNLDRSKADADYRARSRLEDAVLTDSIQPSPFHFLDYPPVEDIAGFDEGVFFNLQTLSLQGDDIRLIDKRLENFVDIQHRFPEGKISWLEEHLTSQQVQNRVSSLALGKSSVVAATLLGAPGIGGGLLAAEDGGRYVVQDQGVDYLLPDNGTSGVVQLITRYGARVSFGSLGTFVQSGTTFTDLSTNFLEDSTDPDIDPLTGQQRVDSQGDLVWLPLVREGFRLKVSSGVSAGSYIVTSVTDANHLEVSPPFLSSTSRPLSWEIFEGTPDSLYDPAVVADKVFQAFDHLPDEPFKVRVLTPLGTLSTGSTHTAFVEDANAQNRPVSLRFGAAHPDTGVTASLSPLSLTDLGVLSNNQLQAPWTTHVSEGAFQIRVGAVAFAPVGVSTFSTDPVGVEYLTSSWDDGYIVHPRGELKFSAAILEDLESSQVYIEETLRNAASLSAGFAEYDPKTGAIQVSTADASTHQGKTLYFVEQMLTTGPARDVAVSPTIGAVSFTKPMSAGALVEMTYWEADTEGRRVGGPEDTITEFLPVFVRREEATRLTPETFELDPNGTHVWDNRVDPLVYIGPTQQNYGRVDFTVDRPGHLQGIRLSFDRALPAWVTPVASYAVFDAQGGERSYTTSKKPVYRPPFFIKAGKDNFGLRGNRVADFVPGQMLRLGAECFYITDVSYFAPSDVTRVDIYPPTVFEVGSRSPGNDILALITSDPITSSLFPDSSSPVTTTAVTGFMQEIPTDVFPFEPVNAKQAFMTFQGDLTQFAVPGHVLEVGGAPYTIAQVDLNDQGTGTKITLTSAFQVGVDPRVNPTIRLSYRPIYPPEVTEFVGKGPLVSDEGVELTLFGEVVGGVVQPGRQLTEGTEYTISSETGVVQLLSPLQASLGPQQKLILSYTQARVMQPFLANGTVVMPRWAARFRHGTFPSKDNGFLGGRLTATYTFDDPDTFYFRALPLRSYMGEALEQAVAEMKQWQSSTGGPRLTTLSGTDNWEQGNLGLPSQRRDLLDKDRVARTFLGFYNDTINAFEQVGETITGAFIGDRSGKFRFRVGKGLEFAPPGYEDEITGVLNPRNVWAQVYNEVDPTRDITFLAGIDPLVDPVVASISDLVLSGDPLDSSTLDRYMQRQEVLIQNDVDDVLLLRSSRPKVVPTNQAPWFTLEVGGTYERMGSPHRFSRIYPTATNVLFTLQPGIGVDIANGEVGAYSFWRTNPNTGSKESTFNKQVGQVSNPVLGPISNTSSSSLRPRQARARVWGYFPNGLSADAFGVAIPEPCMILSAVPLAELAIDPLTGYPDPTQFLSQPPLTGSVPDAVTGDPGLALPGFEPGDKVSLGKPDGLLMDLVYPEAFSIFGLGRFTGVFVREVLYGCVVTFQNQGGNAITSPSQLLVTTGSGSEVPAHQFPVTKADTLYVVPPDAENPVEDPDTESPTVSAMEAAAAASPAFRQNFDLSVRSDGRVMDLSFPSWKDPFFFPIKEILGQKSPLPMGHIEGQVEFANIQQVPLKVPALLGEPKDDSGDYQIPYRKGTATELDRFDEIGNLLGGLMSADGVLGGYYPDEVVFTDGESIGVPAAWGAGFREPSTLLTSVDAMPAPTFGTTAGRPGDFVLVEVDPLAPMGWQGMLSVGAITSNPGQGTLIEPPRFVTPTNKGSVLRYDLLNYAVHTTPGVYPVNPQVVDPAGVRLYESTSLGSERVVISFQDTPLILNDGVTSAVGNLNTILAANAANEVRVHIIGRPDDTYVNAPAGATTVANSKDGRVLMTISIRSGTVQCLDFQGNTYGPFAHNGVLFGDFDPITGEAVPGTVGARRHIVLDTSGLGVPVIPFLPTVGAPNQWFLPHAVAGTLKSSLYGWEYALDVDCTAGGSTSAFIDTDRLTFHEALDLEALSRPRGFLHSNGVGVDYTYQTELRVTQITLGTTGLSAVNDVTGGYLSFLNRTDGASAFAGGTWSGVASPNEDGTLRVMSFEDVNSPIVAANIVAAVQASQTEDPSGGDILDSNGVAEQNRLVGINAATPLDVTRVQKGDTVYLDRSSTLLPNAATEKAGTYIVRHSVQADVGVPYRAVSLSGNLGTGAGLVTTRFPQAVSIDVPARRMVLDDYSVLPATGKIFVVLRSQDLDSADAAVFQRALVSMDFLGVDGSGLILGPLNTWRWADDSAVVTPTTEVTTAMVSGRSCSWHDTPVGGPGPSLPGQQVLTVVARGGTLPDDSSVVGYHNPGTATYGFQALTFENLGATTIVAADILTGAPAAGQARVDPATVWTNEVYDPTNAAVVFNEVPSTLTVYLDDTQGGLLNDPQNHLAGAPGVACLLPGTVARAEDATGAPGFWALGGVFLEPSTPQQALPLGGANPKVVDLTRSLASTEVGMRSPLVPEDVHFEVRRVRRWHGDQNALNDAFQPLRYAYEIRRGTITSFARSPSQVGVVTASAGTNLGGFDDEDVNIHPGDSFRILDANGNLLSSGEISEVVSSTQLKVSAPSFVDLPEASLTGLQFEVYLRQAPVPHEQSNEELLALITDTVVHETYADRTDADPANWVGGYVPTVPDATDTWSNISNLLYDDTPGTNFTTLGVKRGDIVIIDPMGPVEVTPTVFEQGFRPLGDRSVPTRTANLGASPFLAGEVSDFDDNRGFYRVSVVYDDHLEVDPLHTFAGGLGSDVIFGGSRTNLVYSIYPTVSLSSLCVDNAEGQNDLRPTRFAIGGTFASIDPVANKHSLRPFSYKVLRPTGVFSEEIIDTVLMMRERMLSLIEMLGSVTNGVRGGFYHTWQALEHVLDLGSPTDPESGLGLFPNRLVVGLLGETSISPFCNNSTCMSLLDRRFWVLDQKLDTLQPDPNNPFGMQATTGVLVFDRVGGPYTAYNNALLGGSEVRPVLQDHLDLILNVRDRLRSIRYTWLTYRTHRYRGTLASIDRFDADYPERLADRQRNLLLEASVEKVQI